MCVCVSRPMTIDTFLWKNGGTAKRVVDFRLERDTFRNKLMEIAEDFASESHFFSFFFLFSHFFIYFIFPLFPLFTLFHFFILLIFLIFSFHYFIFFHFPSFSFIFHVLSCSFIFFHFLSFSFIFLVFVLCSKFDFFWASISLRFLLTVLM